MLKLLTFVSLLLFIAGCSRPDFPPPMEVLPSTPTIQRTQYQPEPKFDPSAFECNGPYDAVEMRISLYEFDLCDEPELLQNYPNPFQRSTVISFYTTDSCHVRLTIFNVLGQEVANLCAQWIAPGSYDVTVIPQTISSGIYFYQLILFSEDEKLFQDTKKLMLLH